MAVLLDAVAAGASGIGGSLSWTHTIANKSNRALLVHVALRPVGNDDSITGATFNGVAMTSLLSHSHASAGLVARAFYMLNPPVGAYTVQVNFIGTTRRKVANSSSYYNVNQTTPFPQTNTGEGTSTTPSVTVAGTTSGNLVVDTTACASSQTYTPGAGQTERIDQNTGGGGPPSQHCTIESCEETSAGGNVVMSHTIGSSDNWCELAYCIKVSGGTEITIAASVAVSATASANAKNDAKIKGSAAVSVASTNRPKPDAGAKGSAATAVTASADAKRNRNIKASASCAVTASANAKNDAKIKGNVSCAVTSSLRIYADVFPKASVTVSASGTCRTSSDVFSKFSASCQATSTNRVRSDCPVKGTVVATSINAMTVLADCAVFGDVACQALAALDLSSDITIAGSASVAVSSTNRLSADVPIDPVDATASVDSSLIASASVPIEMSADAIISSSCSADMEWDIEADVSCAVDTTCKLSADLVAGGSADCVVTASCTDLPDVWITCAAIGSVDSTMDTVIDAFLKMDVTGEVFATYISSAEVPISCFASVGAGISAHCRLIGSEEAMTVLNVYPTWELDLDLHPTITTEVDI